MRKNLAFLFLLLPFSHVYGVCPEPELLPLPESLEQVSCADCRCVAKAHQGSINALQSERAKLVKKALAPKLESRVNALLGTLVDADRILKVSGTDKNLNSKTLETCSLDRVASEVQCTGAKNTEHLKALFGVDSVSGIVSKLKGKFESSSHPPGLACFSAQEANLIQTTSIAVDIFVPFLTEIKKHKEEILKELQDKSFFKILSEKHFSGVEKRFVSIAKNPLFKAFLYDKSITTKLLNDIDQFLDRPESLSKFIMLQAGKEIDSALVNQSLQASCEQLIDTIKTSICAEDRLAQSYYPDSDRPTPTLNQIVDFDPSLHDPSYDAEVAALMDPPGASIVESSYGSFLFWCSAQQCSQKQENDACHAQALSKEENMLFSDFVTNYPSDEQYENLKQELSLSNDKLCALADCHKQNGEQQNRCAKKIQDEMGHKASSSVAALSFLTDLNQAPGVGDQYVPYSQLLEQLKNPSSLAKAMLGTTAEKPHQKVAAAGEDPHVEVERTNQIDVDSKGSGKVVNSPKQSGQKSVAPGNNYRHQPTNTSSNFFADNAFHDFMNRLPKPEAATKTAVNPSDKRALEQLNEASEEIDRLRDEYRRDALERMEEMFKHAGTRQQQFTPNGSFSPSTGEHANIQNSFNNPTQGGVVPDFSGQNNMAGSARNTASSNGSGINNTSSGKTPRLTIQGGQPTLNVGIDELPAMSEASLSEEGVDPNQPFQLAVKVKQEVYLVAVRPSVIEGKRVLAPMLDQLDPSLRSEVLKSPLFAEYRKYLMRTLGDN